MFFFFKEHTEPGSTDPPPTVCPSQKTVTSRPQPPDAPPPPQPPPYSLRNEREIKKQTKILELKKVNERIHQPRKKCLIIQTHGIRHYMK